MDNGDYPPYENGHLAGKLLLVYFISCMTKNQNIFEPIRSIEMIEEFTKAALKHKII